MEREARKVQEQEHTGNRIKNYVLRDDEKPEDNREKQHGIKATKVCLGNYIERGSVPPGGTPDRKCHVASRGLP